MDGQVTDPLSDLNGSAGGSEKAIPESQDEQETLMAFWLENASPGDPQIHSILVERYGADMCRLADFLLERNTLSERNPSDTLELVSRGFDQAISRLATFRGAPTVRSWLYAQMLRLRRGWRRNLRWPRTAREHTLRSEGSENIPRPGSLDAFETRALEDLPKRARLVIFLHFGLRLSFGEIAYMLGRQSDQIETILSKARSQLQCALRDTGAPDQDLDVWAPLALEARWPAPSPEEYSYLLSQASAGRQEKAWLLPTGVSGNLREILLVFFVLLAALILGWYITRQDKHQGRPLYPEAPIPTPTAVQVAEVPLQDIPGSTVPEEEFALRLEPALSADGRWLAYTQLDGSGNTDVFLYDRQESELTQLDLAPDGSPAIGMSYGPSISANGRWVVFYSDAENLALGNRLTCPWGDTEINCFDVFLYDGELENLAWITRAAYGAPANGHSVMPTISADGRWVAFWSSASNLVQGDTQMCGSGDQEHNCWDVFIYDRQNGRYQRLPIGRSNALLGTLRLYPLGFSADGNYLALTIHSIDQIAGQLGRTDYSQVWVVDRGMDAWRMVSVNPGDRMGEGDSFLPRLSHDGRYAAFVSLADGLVPEDMNGKSDVFVRDLQEGETEIASVSSLGDPGNDHSGILPEEIFPWGEAPGLSTDGRYVTFVSSATNLVSQEEETCLPGQNMPCGRVLLYDRHTGLLTPVVNQPISDKFFTFPGISGDGGTVYYVYIHQDYCPGFYCADILLYDQRSGVTIAPLAGDLDQRQDLLSVWRESRFIDTVDGGGVYSMAFSTTGSSLATGLSNGTIRVWGLPGGELLYTLETHTGLMEDLAYSPDGALLASASQDGRVGLWSAADGALLHRLPSEGGAVFSLAFSPDGRVLFLGSQRAAWSWDVRDLVFSLLDYIEYYGEHAQAVAVSPDGKLLAHGLSDGSLWLRHASNLDVIARVDAHIDTINCLAFSPDGAYLASGGKDNQAQLWRVEQVSGSTWSIDRVEVWGHADWVNDLAFSPDGRWLAVAAFRSDVQLWGIPGSSGQDLTVLAGNFQPLSIEFSPDGRWLAVGSSWGGVRIWEIPAP